MGVADELDDSIEYLKACLHNLDNGIHNLEQETRDVGTAKQMMQSKTVFDLLPERVVLQRPLKIRKMVKPMIEQDTATVDEMLEKYKKRNQLLQQQLKILQLKSESFNS